MEQDKKNTIVGTILTMEKYRFVNQELVGDVCREVFKELEKDE